MADPIPSVDFQLGRITAQIGEMIHGQNNLSQAMTGMEIALEKSIAALAIRVSALEAADQRREGATSLLTVFLKSPIVGWLVGAAISAWAVLTGRVHLP